LVGGRPEIAGETLLLRFNIDANINARDLTFTGIKIAQSMS
jgi:hypothetical protein